METDPTVWLPHSFYRKPEWRWLRAEYLIVTGRRRDSRIDDDWVVRARAVLRGHGRVRATVAVTAARVVWTGDPTVKGELEARLLTSESLDQVAGRCRLPVDVVETYAALFFAVRPMLRATDWLLVRAIGYSPLFGFTGPQPAAIWKLAALAGGSLLLDVVIAAMSGGPLPAGCLKRSGVQRADEDARIRLRAQIWVAVMSAKTDEEFASVVKDRQRLRDLDARATGRVATVTPVLAAQEAFLIALPVMNRKARAGGLLCEAKGGAGSTEEPIQPAFCRQVDADVVATQEVSAKGLGSDGKHRQKVVGTTTRRTPELLGGGVRQRRAAGQTTSSPSA